MTSFFIKCYSDIIRRWGSLVCEGSSIRRRYTLISYLHCLVAIPTNGKARSGNLCNDSGAELYNCSCRYASDVESGDMLQRQQPARHMVNAQAHTCTPSSFSHWRENSGFAFCRNTTWGAVISCSSICVEQGTRCCFWRWKRSLDLAGQLPSAISWAASSQLSDLLPKSAFLIGCKGKRGQPNSRLQYFTGQQQNWK